MIPKINNILYTTDLSKNSAYAFRYAVNSAEHHKAKIHILHVLQNGRSQNSLWGGPFPQVSQAELDESYSERKRVVKEEIKKRLDDFCQRELQNKPTSLKRVASIQVMEGDPAGEILRKADELKADLLILSTHGKGSLDHAFLGKVAEKVLQRIKLPVIVVPIPKETDITFSEI
ncbi:MAG TPA: universal stress protein [Thermodesulfobacteriota bacterium]|nr:universal stress protein [Thermodesulfobacteriota bacterium]